MRTSTLFVFLFVFSFSNFSFSQEKIEKEVHVKASSIPTKAKNWLFDSFEGLKKPKWFLESSQEGSSYEAKFLWKGYHHSVEFDSLGNLLDVEIEISSSEVPTEVWQVIQSYFSKEHTGVKIKKVQRQLIGDESALEDYFDENDTKGITIRYEVVFEGKKEFWQVYEALFDDKGNFISVLKIQLRPVDNLVF